MSDRFVKQMRIIVRPTRSERRHARRNRLNKALPRLEDLEERVVPVAPAEYLIHPLPMPSPAGGSRLIGEDSSGARLIGQDSGGATGLLSGGSLALNPTNQNTFGLPQVIPNVKIQPIYVVDSAHGNTTSALQSQLNAYLQTLTSDGYLSSLLSQYSLSGFTIGNGSVGTPDTVSLAPTTTVSGSPAYDDFTQNGNGYTPIQQMVENEITAGHTAASDGLNNLYIVFTPPGDAVAASPTENSVNAFLGYHSAIVNTGGTHFDYYAVIPDETAGPNANLTGLGLNGLQGEEQVLSHEISEAITDAVPDAGWVNPVTLGSGEVGDEAANESYVQDGEQVQYEWSNALLGPAHAPSSGANDLYINQVTPPAVNIGLVPTQVATFTDSNTSLTASSFSADVFDTQTDFFWNNVTVTGSNGHFAVTATPSTSGAVSVGAHGTAFSQEGLYVLVSTSPINLGTASGAPISVRYAPYTITPTSTLNYTADSGSGSNNFAIQIVGGNYQLSDRGLVVFTQPTAQTTSAINIEAAPTVPGDSVADVNDTLTISGSMRLPVNFDGGPDSVPTATVGTLYDDVLPFVGGVTYSSPFSVNNFVAGGTGLTAGEISTNFTAGTVTVNGTPTGTGTATFSVTATDTAGDSITRTYTLTVIPAIVLSPTSLPNATTGQTGYSQTITASTPQGYEPPYTFSVSAGALPTGMNLNASTGVLNGTPTVANTFNFTITATDSDGATGSRAYTVTVSAGTSAPALAAVFNPTTISVNGTSSLSFTVTNANAGTALASVGFTDVLPSGLTVTNGTSNVGGGTVTTSGANTITLSGASIAANGQLVFSVTVTGATAGTYTDTTGNVSSSNGGTGGTASASLTVVGTPTANGQTVNTAFNTAANITLTGSDPDVPALPLTFAIVATPAHGALSGFNASTGAVTYTPTAGFHGADTFTFTASNGTSTSAAATVTVNVAAGTPTANAQTVNTGFNTAANITLTGSDPDAPALPLTFAIVASPAHGALSGFNASTGAVIYTPTLGYHGSDTFTFTASNGTNISAAATVTLNVATGTPTANAQTVNTGFNTAANITLTASDPDVPALTLTYAIIVSPAHGSLSGFNASTGAVTYTPTGGYHGADTFTFTASNGTNISAAATATLNVATGTPTANAQTVNTGFNTAANITLTASDPDVPALTLTYAIIASPAHGSLSGFNASTGAVTYTPTGGYHGADTFTFTASNGTNISAAATVTLNVATGTPTANAQTVNTGFNTAANITLTGSDPDVPALPLTFAIVASPAHGSLSGFNASTGAVTYTPTGGYHGADTFTFTASNGTSTSAAATVTVNVAAGTPTANGQTVNTGLNTAANITLTASDPDVPALTLTYAIVASPAHGALSGFNASTGAVTYTPTGGYDGTDTFTFTASNGTNVSAAATVTLNVATGTPTANAQTVNTGFNTATNITLTGSDPDVPALTLTYAIVASPAHGSLSGFNANTGAVTYTPTAGYHGADTFTFTASNGTNISAAATVTLNVATGTPTANAQTVNTGFNTAANITLTGSDPDVPALPLTFAIVASPAHGSLSGFNASTGAVTYTPAVGYHGADTFTFTASNGTSTSAAATVTVNVAAGTPTANGQTVNTGLNTAANITLTASDPDVPALTLTYAIVASPAHGALSGFNASTGAVTYTPTGGYDGTDTFTFTASNGTNISAAATVTLNVATGTPTANAQTVNTGFNTATNITLTGSDPDVPALTLTYAIVASPAHGSLSGFNANTGAVTYTPGAGYHGADTFTFTASNGTNISAAATVTLNVATGTPTANAQTVNTGFNTAANITLTGSDPDVPALPLTFAIVASPAHGALSGFNASTGAVTYTPTAGYHGADTFTFTASNGTNISAAATVTLNVATGTPTANAQTVNTGFNTAANITLTGSDPDVPALPLTFAIVASPGHGVLSGFNAGTGAVTYTPTGGYHGADTFTFTASNGTNISAAATVTLNVATGTPTANAQTVNTGFNTAANITLTASDPDVPALTLTYAIVASPAHGVLSGFNASTGAVTYTPTAGYQGGDTFTFTASNGTNTSAAATVTLNVATGTPTANAQTVNTGFNTAANITLTASDPDVPVLALSYAIVASPAHGSLSGFNASTGAVTYTPSAGYHGADTFTFTASNGTNTSAAATVTLNVATGTPTANAQTVNTGFNTAANITLTASDPDVPVLALSYAIVASPAHGSLSGFNASTGAVTYTPSAGYHGADTFTFTASNGTNTSAAATVTLNVATGTPTANAQTVNTGFNTAANITLTSSDPDVPALALSYAIVASPAHGSLSGFNASTGAVTYTPSAGYHGADTFTFTASNGTNTSAVATVTVNVAPGTPTANGQTVNTDVDTAANITLTASDPDVPALPLTYAIVASPGHGSLSGFNASTGAVTYTPNAGYVGADTFTFTASNGTNTSAAVTVTLNVRPVATISGPTAAVAGQPLTYTLSALGAIETNSPYTYMVNWGDGSSPQTYGPATSSTVTHTFTTTGMFTIQVTATTAGNVQSAPTKLVVNVTNAALEPDPFAPGKTALFIGGTTGTDTITVSPAGNSGGVLVSLNGVAYGPFFPTSYDIIVAAQGGYNHVMVSGAPAVLSKFYADNCTIVVNRIGVAQGTGQVLTGGPIATPTTSVSSPTIAPGVVFPTSKVLSAAKFPQRL